MLYITYNDLDSAGYIGIKKKVLAQASAFEKVFGRAYHTCYEGQMMYLMDGEDMLEKDVAVTRKDCNMVLSQWIEKYNITKTYIRYNMADKWFLQFLRFQKERRIKTVLEIPSYPYDGELTYGKTQMEDTYFRRQLNNYISLIATYSLDKEIWGIPCINLYNGVNIEENSLSERKKQENKLVLIAVSSMAFWNGYERILEGMKIYYSKKPTVEVKLKMVGKGPEESYYKILVKQYDLQKYVEFCGELSGEELDYAYDQSDIAVSSLGAYKKQIYDACPLKGGEYCARGLPFICGYNDLRFPKDLDFVMNVSNDAQAIDINDVICFHEQVVSKVQYRECIRDYAEKNLSWYSIMVPVLDYLNG